MQRRVPNTPFAPPKSAPCVDREHISIAKTNKTKKNTNDNKSNTELQIPSEGSTCLRVLASLDMFTSIDEAIRLSVFTIAIMALLCYGWRVGIVEYKMLCNRIRYNRTRGAPTVTLPYLKLVNTIP